MARRKYHPPNIGNTIGNVGNTATHAGGGGKGGGGNGFTQAAAGGGSVASGVSSATGTSSSNPITSAASGVSSVSSGVTSHSAPSAPTPSYSPYQSRATTTVNLKPLISTITDPATRALAPAAIKAGVKYEINPSVLLGVVGAETNFGRSGSGKGYANLGDGSEDGAASIKQAAQYLSEAGFHENPQKAIEALSKGRPEYAQKVKQTAKGFTELDQAARKIELAKGDTHANGVGHFPFRKPEDRPSAKTLRAAAAGVATGGIVGARAAGGYESDRARAVAEGMPLDEHPMSKAEQQAARAAGEGLTRGGAAAASRVANPVGRAGKNTADAIAGAARGINGKQPPQAQGNLQNPTVTRGPHARRVAARLEKAVAKAGGTVPDYVPQQYRALIADASQKTGVPAGLLSALLQQESGFQAQIGSPAGAQGIAQFMPGTAASRGVNPNDPKSAIPGAAQLLAENKAQFGSWDLALAAYNAGGGAVSQYGGIPPYAETQNYVKTIMANAGDTTATAKSVPKQLLQRGMDVLGREATHALLNGGKLIKAPQGEQKVKFDGRYAGSQDVVRAVVGTRVKGDHGGTKNGEAPGVHTPDGDHYRADGYAQDINGTSPGENEPAYNQDTLNKMVANLNKLKANPPVPDLTIGQNWEGTVGKYSVQLLTNEGGTINHIHIGAHPTDGTGGGSASMQPAAIPIKGTKFAVQPPAPPSTGTATTSASTGGATTLAGAINTVAGGSSAKSGGRSASYAPLNPILSAAAQYARASLTPAGVGNKDSQDPLYTAFRPKR